MKKLLVICPTIHRSKKIVEFLESFTKTKSEETDLILGLDEKDKDLENYQKLSETYDFAIGLFSGENITKIFNAIAFDEQNYLYDYFMLSNDDFVFKTPEWDRILIEEIEKHGKGIAYGNDLFQKDNHPTTPVISTEIIKALGWLQMPTLTHLFGDTVWATIGVNAKCLYYRDDVIIEHKHPVAQKAEVDSVFTYTNSEDMYKKDQEAYNQWIIEKAGLDIAKVKLVCKDNK